jgi:hypothetical protein
MAPSFSRRSTSTIILVFAVLSIMDNEIATSTELNEVLIELSAAMLNISRKYGAMSSSFYTIYDDTIRVVLLESFNSKRSDLIGLADFTIGDRLDAVENIK